MGRIFRMPRARSAGVAGAGGYMVAYVSACVPGAGASATTSPLAEPAAPAATVRPVPTAPPSVAPAVPAVAVASAEENAAAPHAAIAPTVVGRPRRELTVREARRYMVALINRDRATAGLVPVELDEGPPTRAGQAHAEDMARNGFLGHWGTDGSVPEQRHTEAGGVDLVLENASCFVDEKRRALDGSPIILAEQVEKTEGMFFNETPPHDGHRLNILRPGHKRVGIGIAQPLATPGELPVPCFSQEFTDPYGTYKPIPRRLRVGEKLHVEGTLEAPVAVAGVGLARVDAPRAIPASEANRRRSYPVPPPYQTYWPAGFKTPIPLAVTGRHFAIDVPVSDGGRAGMYEVSIWAKVPGSSALAIVGLRTLRVD
jgi:uncharacterized protein YkwD